MRAYELRDVSAKSRRVTKPPHRRARKLGTPFGVSPVRARLAEVVEERTEPDRERRPRIGCRLHDREDVLIEWEMLSLAVLLEPDRLLELREKCGEHTGVACKSQCAGRLLSEQQLR